MNLGRTVDMNNTKTVKCSDSEKLTLMYIITCAVVAVQPLLDILSSVVINLGKVSYISVSGIVRALIILAVTVFTLGFYKGRYSTVFKVYNAVAFSYIVVVCLMSAVRGDYVSFLYMLGLMSDTFFFAFMFLLVFETAQTVGHRVHPAVLSLTALIYALTLAINYLSGNETFRYSTSFAVALALLIPSALAFMISSIGRKGALDSKPAGAAISWLMPIAGIVILLVGSVFSNSKPVLYISVIASVVLFVWTFSSWRDGRKANRPQMMRGFIASALFCVLILAALPISPVKSSFDGRFSFKSMFYTYSGTQTSDGTDSSGEPIFGDEEDGDGGDYVPNLDSGYVPGSNKNDDETDNNSNNSTEDKKTTGKDEPVTESSAEAAGDDTSEDISSEEFSSDESTETTKWWQTMPNQSDIESMLSQLSQYIPTRPGEPTDPGEETTQEPQQQTDEPGTVSEDTDQSPAAAIGMGTVRTPALPKLAAINIDRTIYYSKEFGNADIQTKLFGLKFSGMFDRSLNAASKVHSDPITVLLSYGILGFIVYILPALFIFIKLIGFILRNLTSIFRSAGCTVYMLTSMIILILSALDGDILTFSAVGSVAAVILANALSLCDEAGERLSKKKNS